MTSIGSKPSVTPSYPSREETSPDFVIKDGKKYKAEVKIIHHGLAWKVWQGVQAFFWTVISFGIGLAFQTLQNKWKQAKTGDEKTTVYTRYPPEVATTNKAARVRKALKPSIEPPKVVQEPSIEPLKVVQAPKPKMVQEPSIELPKQISDITDSASKVQQTTHIPTTLVTSIKEARGEVTRDNLAEHMQQVVANYYSKPFPKYDEILVEHNGKEVLWKSLTPQEKFGVVYKHSLPHNRPKLLKLTDFSGNEGAWVNHIEERLFRGSLIPVSADNRDPRLSHGSDHGLRVGIFSAVYAGLYNKYDPNVNLTSEDLLAIQLAGAFHDSGRQTEGVDIDDKRSADNAAKNFKKWGFSEKYIKEGEEAISGKDDQKLSNKSLIAKCVQCADSTEYARVGAFNPKYLDIYKEFNGYKADPESSWFEKIASKPLKGGRSLNEFNEEVSAINKEMLSIMHATCTPAARATFSQPGKNYYEEILKVINSKDHPRIHAMFTEMGVIETKVPTIVPVTSTQVQAAQKGTKAPTIVSPTLAKTGELFPGMLSEVKFVSMLGGTTGAQKVEDSQGTIYAKKTTGEKINPDHLRSEYHTNKAYKVLGVKVPEVALYHATTSKRVKEGEEKLAFQDQTDDRPVMLSKFVPASTQDLDKYLESLGLDSHNTSSWKTTHVDVVKKLQEAAKPGFVADCLLANWDVAGLYFDNMRYDPVKNEIWRIDNGSGLDFRAQGGKKSSQYFTAHIQEFDTLRDPNMNSNTALLFATITDEEIIKQIDDILPKQAEFLATIPDNLKDIMGKRFDYLNVYKQQLLSKK